MHMDVVFAHHSFEYGDIFGVADLHDESSATVLYISLQYWVSVFGDPD